MPFFRNAQKMMWMAIKSDSSLQSTKGKKSTVSRKQDEQKDYFNWLLINSLIVLSFSMETLLLLFFL